MQQGADRSVDKGLAKRTAAEEETAVFHLFAGAAAGLFSDGVVHPIDTCRTRLQVQRGSGPSLVYKNTWDTFTQIIRHEGWRSLYKGFPVVAAFTVPAHALYFGSYEATKRLLRPNTPLEEKGPFVHFTGGVVADIAGALVWTPQDVIKQRLQVQRNSMKGAAEAGGKSGGEASMLQVKYRGSWHCMMTIVGEEGFRALWTGFGAGLAVYCPFVGIYFVAYEHAKLQMKKWYGLPSVDDLSLPHQFVGGAYAGAVAAAVTGPLDVIKTRIQVGSEYKGWMDAARQIAKQEGISAFAKGMGARVLWISNATALTIAAYEQIKKAMRLFGDGGKS
ncbi:Mitochondrial carrier [Balamuthia mandrillaris]